MGVRGLTTFINRNENLYLDRYVIPQNSILVLDGESVAANIYVQNVRVRNTFFGGDYEIYADAVEKFFKMLFDCKITPYVVCSGATESRKVDTLMDRMRARINRIMQLDGRTEVDEPIYPLFIGEVFRDTLKKLNVKMVICDFEADLEAANIAKELNVPVLSLDSDFYIFDVKYIPFSLQHEQKIPNLFVKVNRKPHCKEPELLLTCKIFNRENFLNRSGLSKEMLPILTLFLGNDFIERVKDIRRLFKHLNINSPSRDFVGNIINWLRNHDAEKVVQLLLSFFGKDEQVVLHAKIQETIKGYTCGKSKYLQYLKNEVIENKCGYSDEYVRKFPKEFLDKYRRGLYQHNFVEILLNHRYYPKPLVENLNKEHSYKKSYEIISALHKILTNSSSENFVVFARRGIDVYQEVVSAYERELPTYEHIQEMDIDTRKNLFLNILQIDKTFDKDCLDLFEDSWKIMIITLKYLSNVSELTLTFIYALVLCKIIITYVDSKLGQIRSNDELYRCFPQPRRNSDKGVRKKTFHNLSECTSEISKDDSIVVLDSVLSFFWMDNELKYNSRLFDRNLLHLMSEFQATLLHVNFLNALLNLPYQKCFVHNLFNGTFIYKLTNELNRKDLSFVPFLLRKAPTILNCFDFVLNILKDNMNFV